jgi:hypothetical protein
MKFNILIERKEQIKKLQELKLINNKEVKTFNEHFEEIGKEESEFNHEIIEVEIEL